MGCALFSTMSGFQVSRTSYFQNIALRFRFAAVFGMATPVMMATSQNPGGSIGIPRLRVISCEIDGSIVNYRDPGGGYLSSGNVNAWIGSVLNVYFAGSKRY